MVAIKTIKIKGNVAKIWTRDVEPQAMKQIQNVATLPFIFKHVAVMPDVHMGWGCPVGSVIATEGTVMPACVGVDIGCGMCAVKIPFKAVHLEGKLKEIRRAIERVIPLGFNSNRGVSSDIEEWQGWKEWDELTPNISDRRGKASKQLGSLGGGNHFIEICLDENENVWIMLHSGSRNVGKTLADIHIGVAKRLMDKKLIQLPDRDLAYLTDGTKEFKSYVHDVMWAQEYARKNREVMMDRILKQLSSLLNNGQPIPRLQSVNCHHNYVAIEKHFGRDVYVTRKGAVRAGEGDWGIIPGSMGARSYIVRGLGNADSFQSCAHGAGRRMSRHEAKRKYSKEDLAQQTKGVECRKDRGVVDEIPSAYKNIEEVMDNQKDLVKIEVALKQVVCVKG